MYSIYSDCVVWARTVNATLLTDTATPLPSSFANSANPFGTCGAEAGSYLRLIDSRITQIKAQGPSRTTATPLPSFGPLLEPAPTHRAYSNVRRRIALMPYRRPMPRNIGPA